MILGQILKLHITEGIEPHFFETNFTSDLMNLRNIKSLEQFGICYSLAILAQSFLERILIDNTLYTRNNKEDNDILYILR